MNLELGEYYYLDKDKVDDDRIIVKIIDDYRLYTSLPSHTEYYIHVLFIRVPDKPMYDNWKLSSYYGISIPISVSEFNNARKLTYDELVALEL